MSSLLSPLSCVVSSFRAGTDLASCTPTYLGGEGVYCHIYTVVCLVALYIIPLYHNILYRRQAFELISSWKQVHASIRNKEKTKCIVKFIAASQKQSYTSEVPVENPF